MFVRQGKWGHLEWQQRFADLVGFLRLALLRLIVYAEIYLISAHLNCTVCHHQSDEYCEARKPGSGAIGTGFFNVNCVLPFLQVEDNPKGYDLP